MRISQRDRDRHALLLAFDQSFNLDLIAGVDEVGRGALAGPIVAAACILPPKHDIYALNDSKKISEKRRQQVYLEIKEKALSYATAMVLPNQIDLININQANNLVMTKAIANLAIKPELILSDASSLEAKNLVSVTKGDSKSASIAAASIIAKCKRDQLMLDLAPKYPVYNWQKNKGYAVKEHIESILAKGPSSWHRSSFLRNFNLWQRSKSPLRFKLDASFTDLVLAFNQELNYGNKLLRLDYLIEKNERFFVILAREKESYATCLLTARLAKLLLAQLGYNFYRPRIKESLSFKENIHGQKIKEFVTIEI